MQVQQVRSNQQSFGRFYCEDDVTGQIYKSLVNAPAVKKFGEKYSGRLSVDTFWSSKNKDRVQYALTVDNIQPVKFWDKVRNLFNGGVDRGSVSLKTHATSPEELADRVAMTHSDTLLHIYEK